MRVTKEDNTLIHDYTFKTVSLIFVHCHFRGNNGVSSTGCIALKANTMDWDTEDCTKMKDFICEQTRCYFYNYGSIPVSPSQG